MDTLSIHSFSSVHVVPTLFRYDVQDTVYRLLPVAMVVTMIIVFAIVGIAFRSLVVPLRAVLTIVFTLTIVFGASVLVYQHGVLDSLGIPCLHTIANSQVTFKTVVLFTIKQRLTLRHSLLIEHHLRMRVCRLRG